MRRIKFILLTTLLLLCTKAVQGQIATNLKISEVVVDNPSGLIDEYGQRNAWIEICNTSWGTVNLRNCYLTTDRKALEEMPVPERVKLMSLIPPGDSRTKLKAKEHIVFFADARPNLGTLHTKFKLTPGQENFIALFDGNGHTLLDSVTIPANTFKGYSYARFSTEDGKGVVWKWCKPQDVTPGSANSSTEMASNKVAEFKEKDPHGFGMSILGMGIVFCCLILLAIFFTLFGKIFARIDKKKSETGGEEIPTDKQNTGDSATEDEGVVVAVISMALRKALYDLHDNESGVLTIKRRRTNWTRTGGSN